MHIHRLSSLLCALAALLAPPARGATALPVKTLSNAEIGALSGMPYLSPINQPFRMAAGVKVAAHDKGTPAQAVARKSNGSDAAVYRGLPASSPNPPLLPTWPAGTALLDFIPTGDLAQAWATMSATGQPYLYATGYGEFSVDASASWTTSLTIPAGGSRELVVRVVIPPVGLAGATEQEGIARWRARLRAELLVNGFPAWSTESMRLALNPHLLGGGLAETLVLQQFGDPLSFPTNDEDTPLAQGGLNNDSNSGNVSGTSAPRTLHVSLGRFAAGTAVDLSMILRATALSTPKLTGGTDHRCKYSNSLARYFCSRGTVTVNGSSGEAPRIFLLP